MFMEKLEGILFIIFGLLFIIYPIFSSAFVSLVIGLSLVCFGLSAIGVSMMFDSDKSFTYLLIAIGLLSILLGIGFMIFLNAISFIVSFQFYIIGIILVAYGLIGILYLNEKTLKIRSALLLILGIITIILAAFAATQPIIIAIILGVALIIEGAFILVLDKSMDMIERYG